MFCSRLAKGEKNTAGDSMGVGRILTCVAPEPLPCFAPEYVLLAVGCQ